MHEERKNEIKPKKREELTKTEESSKKAEYIGKKNIVRMEKIEEGKSSTKVNQGTSGERDENP